MHLHAFGIDGGGDGTNIRTCLNPDDCKYIQILQNYALAEQEVPVSPLIRMIQSGVCQLEVAVSVYTSYFDCVREIYAKRGRHRVYH